MIRWLEMAALLLAALALAPALAHAAELPGKMRLDRETYTAVQPIYYPGFTIVGIAEPASLVALLWLLLATPMRSASFWLYAGALLALGAMQAIYWTVTHPVNRVWLQGQMLPRAGGRFFGARANAGKDGARHGANRADVDWQGLRHRWEYSHVWRAAFAGLALALLALGVAW
jgi:hypothetical protein